MITGIGFTEVFIVLIIVLIFFGSKELPHFIRETAKLVGKLRQYSNQFRQEIHDMSNIGTSQNNPIESVQKQKNELRKKFRTIRDQLSDEERSAFSASIAEKVIALPQLKESKAVMIYLSHNSEVATDALLPMLKQAGKRVIVPWCKVAYNDLGIAEIHDISEDTAPGRYGIREPREQLRGNFLKSDISVVLCPGLAFDTDGKRLGHGKGYYDTFLNEIRDHVYIVGLAYQCQISDTKFPFDYTDVAMDEIITEQGPVLNPQV